ncbi:MAG: T9SS type A sorting domain-containing protein [Bacteroidia bacterium]
MKKIYTAIFIILNLISINYAIAQWEHIKSFTGGNTTCMAKDDSIVYACVQGFGLVRSTDDGNNWVRLTDTLFSKTATSISIEGSKIILCQFDLTYFIYSLDSGLTWQTYSMSVFGPNNSLSDVKFYKKKVIATDCKGKVYKSNGIGFITWKKSTIGISSNQIEIVDGRIFLVPGGNSSDHSYYTSADTGKTWTILGSVGLSCSSFTAKGDTLVITIPTNKIYISTNFGASWVPHPCPASPIDKHRVVYLDNDTLYYLGEDTIFKSFNLGTTWNYCSNKAGLSATTLIKSAGHFLIGSSEYACLRFYPAYNTIFKKSDGIYGSVIKRIRQKGDTLFVATEHLFCISFNNGRSWNYSSPFGNYSYYFGHTIDFDNNAVYTNLYNNIGLFVLKSTDWGLTWIIHDTVPCDLMKILCYNNELYCATGCGVYKSSVQGIIPIKKINNQYLFAYGIAIFNNVLFASSWDSIYSAVLDTNPQFVITTIGLPHSNNFQQIIANDSSVFIGAAMKGVYRYESPNTGWNYIGLFGKHVSDFATYNNDVYAASGVNGITILQNYTGSNWNPVNFGLDGYNPVHVSAGDSFIFCGGDYHGLYRRLRSEVLTSAGISENSSHENSFYLSPNPASDAINVSGITNSTNASLTLFDITGRICFQKVISLKGNFNLNINVSEFSDGIYFLNLDDDKKSCSQKVMIVH